LEYLIQTGELFSKQQVHRGAPPEFASRIALFVLDPPRKDLYERINARTVQHFGNGLLDEVKHLRAAGVNDDSNALGSHGYRRICEYLRGERTFDEALEKTQQDVRNYAKRQRTWFKREESAIWLDGFGDDPAIRERLFERVGLKSRD
jgi:tRNA dimethylallyltransferase